MTIVIVRSIVKLDDNVKNSYLMYFLISVISERILFILFTISNNCAVIDYEINNLLFSNAL